MGQPNITLNQSIDHSIEVFVSPLRAERYEKLFSYDLVENDCLYNFDMPIKM